MARGHDTTGAATSLDPSVTDEELNAYIDGELSYEQRRTIERLIPSDEKLRARVEALLWLRELVRNAYNSDKDN